MQVNLPAPAKINLHLAVTGKTANGYHTLDTSFAYIDTSDTLLIEQANKLHVTCSEPTLNTRDNLVFHVLDAMRRTFNVKQGMKIHIEKELPVQAGLGGGSSDAATAIMAANILWQLNMDSKTLIEFAAPLGADIPCFLFGRASRATGIGEQLEALDMDMSDTHLVLAHPGIGLSTVDVFSCYDAELESTLLKINALQLNPQLSPQLTPSKTEDNIRADSMGRAGFTNDKNARFPLGENALETVACGMCPALAALLQYMREQAKCAWMSGSGTTCVALVKTAADAHRLARELKRQKLAVWIHTGKMLHRHPLRDIELKPDDWGVAKR